MAQIKISQLLQDTIEAVITKLAGAKWIKQMRGQLGAAGTSEQAADKVNAIAKAMKESGYTKARQVSKGIVGHGALSDVYAMYDPAMVDKLTEAHGLADTGLIAHKVPRNELPNFINYKDKNVDTRKDRPAELSPMKKDLRQESNANQQAMTDIQKAYGAKSVVPSIVTPNSEVIHQPYIFGFKSLDEVGNSSPDGLFSHTDEFDKAFTDKTTKSRSGSPRYQGLEGAVRMPEYAPADSKELAFDLNQIRNVALDDLHEGNIGIVPANLNKHINPNLHGLSILDYTLHKAGVEGPHRDTGKLVEKFKGMGMPEEDIVARLAEQGRGPANTVVDARQHGLEDRLIAKILKSKGFSDEVIQQEIAKAGTA